MADRVKYFVLGLLFLVVAGVIAYDKWNRRPIDDEAEMVASGDDDAAAAERDRFEVLIGPNKPDLDVTPEPEPKPRPGPIRPIERDFDSLKPFDPAPEPDPGVQPGPERQPEPVRPEPKPEQKPKPIPEKVHVVKRGENLSKISKKYYKTVKGVAWIVTRNRLSNPDDIREGQRLVIPARNETAPRVVDPKKIKKKPVPAKVPSRYTVKKGDGDLYAICRRFYGTKGEGARVARIMEMNGLWSANVKAGTILRLPSR